MIQSVSRQSGVTGCWACGGRARLVGAESQSERLTSIIGRRRPVVIVLLVLFVRLSIRAVRRLVAGSGTSSGPSDRAPGSVVGGW